MSVIPLSERTMYKRLSINTNGDTQQLTQSADNLSEALEQELVYFKQCNKTPAQINIWKA